MKYICHHVETTHCWPFVWRIHRSPVNSPHKGQWCGALLFSLICASTNTWANNGDVVDLRCHHTHYDVTVMGIQNVILCCCFFFQPLEVHETIAECMIFANHWVAKKICQAFPKNALVSRGRTSEKSTLQEYSTANKRGNNHLKIWKCNFKEKKDFIIIHVTFIQSV